MMAEFMISLLLNMMVAGTGIMMFITGVQQYVYAIGNWELVSEMRMAMQQMTERATYGSEIFIKNSKLYIKRNKDKDNYYLDNYYLVGSIIHYKRYNNTSLAIANQPLTGDSIIGSVKISKLTFTKQGHTLNIKLEGINMQSGHKFKLEADVLCHGELLENA